MSNFESDRESPSAEPLLSAAQMRAIEQAAMAAGAATGAALMERAGEGVVQALLAAWPELAAAPGAACVLCGPGNNGGDGFVVARLLAERGWRVRTLLLGESGRMPPDARANLERWRDLGEVLPLDGDAAVDAALAGPGDLLVDALFGIGLTRPLSGAAARAAGDAVQAGLRARGTRRLAIEIPSGLCADSGRALDPVLPADLTVSFHRAKLGHVLSDGPRLCGRLVVADIGLGPDPMEREAGAVTRVAVPLWAASKPQGHKFDHGHALVLTGSFGRTGAARLAARAALRAGAGLVTLGAPGAAQMEVACRITSEMMTRIDTEEALRAALEDARLSALCLGPGLGADRARALVPAALDAGHGAAAGASARGVVLDADALSAFADDPGALFSRLSESCVLTPHGGEFARLFPDLAARLAEPATAGPAFSRVDAARAAAARAGCVVLLKGPDTVIAAPDGRCAVHDASGAQAAPWLATAGAGDVLAGLVCGLMARGRAAYEAAQAAAWLHVAAARGVGPGLVSEDLPDRLPAVLGALADG